MPITDQQRQAAEAVQDSAARDPAGQVRVVAGPGTGKSRSIEERVRWLLSQGSPPANIHVVSFTRAASRDLAYRIQQYCIQNGQPGVAQVWVSTLHSLALRLLRAGGLLAAYPVGPYILDNWELENIIDAEFSQSPHRTRTRCSEIRRHYDAFWSTGQWGPPNYVPPTPPITNAERNSFAIFHLPRTQTYSCLLPGEVIRQCVNSITAGLLDPVGLLAIRQFVVDEYQDLNPCDIDFIDELIRRGVVTFVAGDDDQSIYAFRFASPPGIQSFLVRHPTAGNHTLSDCFRCSTDIVAAATSLITHFAMPGRIPKTLVSLHANANPTEAGVVHRWVFDRDFTEARALAESCRDLIAAGIQPREILILVSDKRQQVPLLSQQLEAASVNYESPRADSFLDEDAGRFVLGTMRVVCDPDDYVAHRVLLGTLPGIGPGTCDSVANQVLNAHLRYRDVFYVPLPAGLLRGLALSGVNRVRCICAELSQWRPNETLTQRNPALSSMVTRVFGVQAANDLNQLLAHLPGDMTLEEVRNYLWADNDEQQARILEKVYQRLNLPLAPAGFLPPKVRIMTMHGAKGLNATVVFVPSLEETILPGNFRRPYSGLVLEAARLLYVSITRARAACILSFARERIVYGRVRRQPPSQFLSHTGGSFVHRTNSLSSNEVQRILIVRANVLN